ncbi:MAG: DSBA-like thioredoxin domain protein [Alphaproteobacteria bacterium]|nr:DSBA-like thioredoxin domain protein [Alphaproteobacteria bacterium]MDB5740754.1 DSBA-like thioredoxin domain protein [Alphaproteobacteria bacterium]
MSRKQIYVVLGVLLLAVLGGLGWYLTSDSGGTATAAASGQGGAGWVITPKDRTMGNKNAKVVLIEYAAPVCPHCARFNMEFFPDIKKKYIDTGKIFYIFRVYPIRPDDGPAEKLASCLPEDKYFSFIDLLFRNQPKWDGAEYPVTDDHAGLLLMARIAGMSAEQADACMSSKAEDERINKVASDGEARYNLTSTPTFIVNGVPKNSLPFEDLSKVLDTELAKK